MCYDNILACHTIAHCMPRLPESHRVLLVVVLVVSALVVVAAFGAAQPSYSISAAESIDIPQRTVTVEGDDSVGDAEHDVRVNATKTNDGYVADVPTDALPAGDYSAYTVARGDNETEDGRKVLVDVSDRSTLTVTEPTPTPTESSASDVGGDGAGTPTQSSTVTPTNTSTPTATESQPITASPTPTPVPSPTVTASPPSTGTASPTQSPTDDSVTAPASPTATGTPTDGSGPGFGLLVGIVALALAGLLVRRH